MFGIFILLCWLKWIFVHAEGSGAMCISNCNCDWTRGRITCSNLRELPNGLLNSSLVKQLFLHGNNISTINRSDFESMENIEKLDISNNRIRTVQAGTFSDFKYLTDLDLSENNLRVIKEGTFKNLPLLQNLKLPKNKIVSIDRNSFVNLPLLYYINLENNQLTNLNLSAFDHVHNLEALYLNDNKLTSFPINICETFPSLKTVYADDNKISTFRKFALTNCVKITYLSLRRNIINTVHHLSFTCQSFTYEFTPCLVNLKSLFLNHNNISKIPKALEKLNDLTELELSGNSITKITKDDFSGLVNLEVLIMSRLSSQLTIDDFAFSELVNIKRIVLSYNKGLKSIPETAFSGLKKLDQVFLENCSLVTLPYRMLNWNALRTFDTRNNKLNCDCKLKWIQNLGHNLSRQVRGVFDSLTCFSPLHLKNKLVATLREEEFHCYDAGRILQISFILAGTLVLTLTLCVVFVKFRKKIFRNFWKWFNHSFRKKDEDLYIIEHDYYDYLESRQVNDSNNEKNIYGSNSEATV